MKIQRIYTDTSVIGGCFDKEFAPWSKGLMKDFRLGNFKPVLSDVVLAELNKAPDFVRDQYAEMITYNPEFIDLTEETYKLATRYQNESILPQKFSNDGLHIALATIAEVDLLVSWNFKHIVHFEKIRLFNAVNLEQGYKSLQIYSPREVTNYEEE